MSSHHIVREKQEPALLILGLAQFDDELLGQLLEWSPTVIVAADIAEKVDSNGIKIDWIVGDLTVDSLQLDIKLIHPGSDTLTEVALKYLVAHQYPAVNIVTDNFQLKDYLFFTGKIDLVIFKGGQKIFPVSSGFSKWKPAGQNIELLTAGGHLFYTGLAPIGHHLFQTTHDGFFTLQFDQPFLFIAEEV